MIKSNLSINPDLLQQIDNIAKEKSRSCSELIREAARTCMARKRRWAKMYEIGTRTAASKAISPEYLTEKMCSYRGKRQQ